jgi:glycosyltransferase involved in cell wall biosynthesis
MKWFQRPHAYYLPSAVNTQLLFNRIVPRDIPIGFCGFTHHQPRQDFLDTLLNAFPRTFRPAEGSIFLGDLAEYYSRCQIVVNDCQWTEVPMRVFEAAACEACLVTKRVPGIAELFEEDVEAVFYDDWPEMVDKVADLLTNIGRRARIARAGMERVRRDHTYIHRAKVVKEIMQFSQGAYLHFGNSTIQAWEG